MPSRNLGLNRERWLPLKSRRWGHCTGRYGAIYIAPLAAAGVFFLGFLISLGHHSAKLRGLTPMEVMHGRQSIAMPYDMAAGLLMLTGMLVGAYYCLDTLY